MPLIAEPPMALIAEPPLPLPLGALRTFAESEPWLVLRLGYNPYAIPALDGSSSGAGNFDIKDLNIKLVDVGRTALKVGLGSSATRAAARGCPEQCRCVRTRTSRHVCTVLSGNPPKLAHAGSGSIKQSRWQRSHREQQSFCDVRSNVATAYHRTSLESLQQVTACTPKYYDIAAQHLVRQRRRRA